MQFNHKIIYNQRFLSRKRKLPSTYKNLFIQMLSLQSLFYSRSYRCKCITIWTYFWLTSSKFTHNFEKISNYLLLEHFVHEWRLLFLTKCTCKMIPFSLCLLFIHLDHFSFLPVQFSFEFCQQPRNCNCDVNHAKVHLVLELNYEVSYGFDERIYFV